MLGDRQFQLLIVVKTCLTVSSFVHILSVCRHTAVCDDDVSTLVAIFTNTRPGLGHLLIRVLQYQYHKGQVLYKTAP